MRKEHLPFTVPAEFHDRIDDHAPAVHEKYQKIDLNEVKEAMGEQDQGVILLNDREGDPEAGVNVLALPHQQAWKPHMALRSYVHHEINNPNGVTVVLPNNGLGEKSYDLSKEDRKKIHDGDMRPFYEGQTRSVEKVLQRYKHLRSEE